MAVNYEVFVNDAQKVSKETGIPTSIILGQIVLESSGKYPYGLSGLAYQGKNLFGIKGSGSGGSITLPTTEYINGKPQTVYADFRKYNSFYESILDHAKLLQNDRYQQHISNAKTVSDFATGIWKGGYATDPKYPEKLMNVISTYNLTKYDDGLPVGNIAVNPDTFSYYELGKEYNESLSNSTAITETDINILDEQIAEKGVLGSSLFTVFRFLFIIIIFVLIVFFFVKAFNMDNPLPNPTKIIKKGVKSSGK